MELSSRSVDTETETLELTPTSMFRSLTASLGDLTRSATTGKARTVKAFDAQILGEKFYKHSHPALGKRLKKTLNEHVMEAPERHGEDLKHSFIKYPVIKQFITEIPTRKKGYQITQLNMHDSYEKFQAFIAALLEGQPPTAPLYTTLKAMFLDAGFDIKEATDGEQAYRLVYVGLAQRKAQSEPSLLEAIKLKVSKVYSSTEHLHKSKVIKSIDKANQERLHLKMKTLLLRDVVNFHGKYVTWCKMPPIEHIDFSTLTDRKPKQEDTLAFLENLQANLEKENRAIEHEFTRLYNSLPSTFEQKNQFRLMTLPDNMSVTKVCNDMEVMMSLTPGWRDVLRNTRVLYRRAYVDESAKNTTRFNELREFKRLFEEMKHIVTWEDIDKAVWAQNLMVEWLRSNTPDALCTVGPFKCSSGLRKAWKGQLAAWDISWKPRITGAHATAVTPSCFQRFSCR
ncbi:hypothetical protein [Kistimonas asteriae]|uniref:hypothetical protein n=1 Tax=Kistimonas asteriae TaxID=517724 RepID=UPI001BADAC85|nr:hypothetical protein [Kistimonas asteriae]